MKKVTTLLIPFAAAIFGIFTVEEILPEELVQLVSSEEQARRPSDNGSGGSLDGVREIPLGKN